MSAEQNAAAVRRLFDEAFNEGHFDVVSEILAPDYEERQSGVEPGPDGVKKTIATLRSAFPNLSCTIEHVAEQGDFVWAHVKVRGTHEGPLMGFAASHRPFEIDALHLWRFANGRIVEHWGVPDRMSAMEQLGLVPRPQSVSAR